MIRANKRVVCLAIKIWTWVEDGWLWRRPNPMISYPLLQISPVKLQVMILLSWTESILSLNLCKSFDCHWESKHQLIGEERRCHGTKHHVSRTAQWKSAHTETARKIIFPAPADIPLDALSSWPVLSKSHARPSVDKAVTSWLLTLARRSRSRSADRSKWEIMPHQQR